MLDLRSRCLKVRRERRKAHRLELRAKVSFEGKKGIFELTDFSTGGFFAQMENKNVFELGQVTTVAIKFPNEKTAILQKGKIASINQRGIGCQFINPTSRNLRIIKKCFNLFRNTLPIR